MEIPNLYALQGTRQLQFLIGHLQASDKNGKLILIAHGYMQLLVGMQSNFLNADCKCYSSWIQPTWFSSIWAFLHKTGVQIIMVDAWLPPPLHVNDVNIMEYFTSQNLTHLQLESMNPCHVYLKLYLYVI